MWKKKSLTDGGGHSPPLNVNGQSLIIKKNRIVKMAWTSANTAIVVVYIFWGYNVGYRMAYIWYHTTVRVSINTPSIKLVCERACTYEYYCVL